ncbi:hypothetical protein AB0M54_42805 [Actinoplanes sp. NPDC051470]|uniref:hypothetical protein n=1 Tax=Actinoplanes sp. NPDC051470 TaxID=3157224 RepID=UPI0034457F1F
MVVTATIQTLRSAAGSRRHSPGSSCMAITAVSSTAATTSAITIAAYAPSQLRRSRPSARACGATAANTSTATAACTASSATLNASLAPRCRRSSRSPSPPARARVTITVTGSKASRPRTIGNSLRLIACAPRLTRR